MIFVVLLATTQFLTSATIVSSTFERRVDVDSNSNDPISCSPTSLCGRPILDLPRCEDGRLYDVACVHDGIGVDTCSWVVQENCFGDTPMRRVRPRRVNGDVGKRKPIVAIVLSGQVGRVMLQSKLDRLFLKENRDEFDIVVVAALSGSPNLIEKLFNSRPGMVSVTPKSGSGYTTAPSPTCSTALRSAPMPTSFSTRFSNAKFPNEVFLCSTSRSPSRAPNKRTTRRWRT